MDRNLRIEYNQKIIGRFQELDIPADNIGSTIFVMFALYEERYDLLDQFDDGNKERRAIILYRQMYRRGLLEEQPIESKYHYKLSSLAVSLVDYIKREFQTELHVEIKAEDIKESVTTEAVEDWIEEYVACFPEKTGYFNGKPSGRTLRQHPEDALPRMKEFIEKYKYSKDTIIAATKAYLKEQTDSPSEHQFTINSTFFIHKGIGKEKRSELSTWCKNLVDNKKNNVQQQDSSILDVL